MLDIRRSSQFKKDLKKILKQHKDLEVLEWLITTLQEQKPVPQKYCDHALSGDWKGYRECHVSPDWLLVYKIEKDLRLLKLMRTGSHAELF